MTTVSVCPPRSIQFSIVLSIPIMSVLCFIFVFYCFLTDRTIYSTLSNYVILMLLASSTIQTLIDISINLDYDFNDRKTSKKTTHRVRRSDHIRFFSMNEANIASLVLGVVAGFYSTIFLLCISDVVHLNKEMIKMKHELADIRNQSIIFDRTSSVDLPKTAIMVRKNISGKLCLSYNEQRQILEYINFLCNMGILLFGSYSIYVHGIGTYHGLTYRLVFFIFKLCTIVASILLNLYFKKGLPSDIFLYIWIDVNCVVSVYRSLSQIM